MKPYISLFKTMEANAEYNIEIFEDGEWTDIFRTPFKDKRDADIALLNCLRHHPEGKYQIVETWA